MNVSVCLTFNSKNEDIKDKINEFLNWHSFLGFSHFYLFDKDLQTDGFIEKNVLSQYQEQCTLLPTEATDNDFSQMKKSLLDNKQDSSEWVVFLDLNDMVQIAEEDKKITDLILNYNDCDAIAIKRNIVSKPNEKSLFNKAVLSTEAKAIYCVKSEKINELTNLSYGFSFMEGEHSLEVVNEHKEKILTLALLKPLSQDIIWSVFTQPEVKMFANDFLIKNFMVKY